MPQIRDGLNNSYPTGEFGQDTWWNDSNRQFFQAGRIGLKQWKTVVDEYIPRQMSALYNTRYLAAKETSVQSRMYNDFAKDLPPAQNADELRQQYATINAYSDRTELMKDYLKQKAATRSLLRSVGVAGYGDYFSDAAHKKGDYDKNSLSLDGLLPHKYDDDSMYEVPAWLNKDEAGIADWIDLSDARRKKESDTPDKYSSFIDGWSNVSVYGDPNKVIDDFGKLHGMTIEQRKKIEDDRRRAEQDLSDIQDQTLLDDIPFNNRVKTGKRAFNAYWSKKITRRNKKLQIMQRIQELHESIDKEEIEQRKFGFQNKETPYTDKPTMGSGELVTYEKFLSWVGPDSKTAPEYELSEPSRAHVYKALLEGVYSWAPDNITIDEENLPDGYLRGYENTFRHMLENLDPADRQRADRMHNQVHAPDTAAYMAKYHPDAKEDVDLAQDAAGTRELFSDWDLHYEKNINKVKFNNHIVRQMDFGVSEGV